MAEQKTHPENDPPVVNDAVFNVDSQLDTHKNNQSRPYALSHSSHQVGVATCSLQHINGVNVSLAIDAVIIEEPLEIRLIYSDSAGKEQERVYLVTMRTPGDDLNLVTGLLLAEGIINKANDIVGINEQFDLDDIYRNGLYDNDARQNEIHVQLSPDVVVDWTLINRDTTSFSSCGVCGKSSIKSLELRNIADLDPTEGWLSGHVIPHFSEQLRQYQSMFNQTGGVHGCALFDAQGALLMSCEDVGRHNALDKLMGKLARSSEFDQQGKVVFLSGRISFELVQKVLVSGISVLIAVGAPSNLAINMAKRFNLTLIGFSRDGGFNVYHGAFRLNLLNDNRTPEIV
ncbi:formate dehydrogenase accessory sulfurtransferase FdhD [Moritella sp. Urea-trap-13]|uniref:formate dehydrogenase accessory sulfurtransferase FdhD n=1 Tax=Moritella sp. Urea-trap-13 TaxID=2058327 RepID=UPI000C3377D2|nr:formate dehydrogenase accessory sulfurtransferase FdhD [Moritella sp. Urea-trap-13]PKH07261.1 formate dehydrogenase family accessory protein FdhD [Moritella sp. Urea-trap-13]